MHCRTMNTTQGMAIACGSKPKKKSCYNCGGESYFLCDYVVPIKNAGGVDVPAMKTCDKPMCLKCATRVGFNKDYCKEHAAERTND